MPRRWITGSFLGRSSMRDYDVAIVGLGVVGASAVYAAAWAGARVLALDAGAP